MQYVEPDRRLPAFGIALFIHIAALFLWSHLSHAPEKLPVLFEIELTHPSAQSEKSSQPALESPPPEPIPAVTKPNISRAEPTPTQQTQPTLTAKQSTPDTPKEFVVPETAAQAQQPVVATNALVTPPSEEKARVTETQASSTSSNQKVSSQEAEPTEAWNGYGQMLYDLVSKNKTYPAIAVRRNWEGKVKILARFDQGKLMSASILESGSGHQVLDDAALDMLRKAVNALPVRGNLANKAFTLVIPIDFKLEG